MHAPELMVATETKCGSVIRVHYLSPIKHTNKETDLCKERERETEVVVVGGDYLSGMVKQPVNVRVYFLSAVTD